MQLRDDMNILFVHENMLGQYGELAQWFAAQNADRIYFLTQCKNPPAPMEVVSEQDFDKVFAVNCKSV